MVEWIYKVGYGSTILSKHNLPADAIAVLVRIMLATGKRNPTLKVCAVSIPLVR
jgi:hypothetical protein